LKSNLLDNGKYWKKTVFQYKVVKSLDKVLENIIFQ